MSRHETETERLKIGTLKAVFFHRELDSDGKVVSAWVSCGSQYQDKDMGKLLEAISERYHEIIEGVAK